MYERILVPLDGSTVSEQVIPHVREMAKRFDSHVLLVRAVSPLVATFAEAAPGELTAGSAGDFALDLAHRRSAGESESAQRYLTGIAEGLERDGIRTQWSVLEGAPGPVILEHASAAGASLIIMSTHARGVLGQLVHGSVAAEVLQNAEVPVLFVGAVRV